MTPAARYPDLDGASVLVTGGGTGIGAALVEGFAAQGARVAFIDILAEPSRALAGHVADRGFPAPLFLETDLRDVAALREAVAQAAAAHGPVTVLVNNAAWDDRHRLDELTVDYWDNNQAINLRPQVFAAQAVAPGMREKGFGSIVNFSSIAYLANYAGFISYNAAKAAVVGVTKGLAGELGPDNIRVNAIAPGMVVTERQKALWLSDEGVRSHVAQQCLRRVIAASDMVGPTLFLASTASAMVTAQTLIVDGGYF